MNLSGARRCSRLELKKILGFLENYFGIFGIFKKLTEILEFY